MQEVTEQIRNFIQYVAVQFIQYPENAQLKVAEIDPSNVRFKLILDSSDVAVLIGRNGFTASTIRGVIKAATERAGIRATLHIHSHEDEERYLASHGD